MHSLFNPVEANRLQNTSGRGEREARRGEGAVIKKIFFRYDYIGRGGELVLLNIEEV